MTTPSPNPVESLRALPELTDAMVVNALANLQVDINGPYRCSVTARAMRTVLECFITAWNRRPASAPDAERYEYVRALNPQEFTKLWTRCLIDDKRFDDLVDAAILAKHSTAAEEGHG